MSDWEALRYVLAASHEGSLTGAARALRVDPATVSRKIAALEEHIGGKLFARSAGKRLEPTPLGERVLRAAVLARDALDEAARAGRAEQEGTLRVTTSELLAVHFVAPSLPDFYASNPTIALELIVTPAMLDLSKDADVALRVTRPEAPALVSRRAGAMRIGVYAAPSLVGARGRVCEGLPVIAIGEQFMSHGENRWIERVPGARVVLRSTSISASIVAARLGLGAALLPSAVAEAPASGLVPLAGLTGWKRDIWLVMHPDLAKSRRVRAFSEFASGIFRR